MNILDMMDSVFDSIRLRQKYFDQLLQETEIQNSAEAEKAEPAKQKESAKAVTETQEAESQTDYRGLKLDFSV